MIQGFVVDTNRLSVSFHKDLSGFLVGEEDYTKIMNFSDPFPSPYYYVTDIGDLYHIDDKESENRFFERYKSVMENHLLHRISVNEELLFRNPFAEDFLKEALVEKVDQLRDKLDDTFHLEKVPSRPYAASVITLFKSRLSEEQIESLKKITYVFAEKYGIEIGILGFRWIVFTNEGEMFEEKI